MSKTTLKKHLQQLSKDQLVSFILDVYASCKPAQEYMEYFLDPDEEGRFTKFRDIIVNEFYPKGKYAEPKTRFAIAKRAIADFRALNPSPERLGDLMVTLAEMACKFTYDYGDMWEQYYTSAATNFEQALKFLHKNNLLDQFKLRLNDCVKYASPCGYGFAGDISQLFYDYYD